MKVIGLTGGIGAGKGEVASILNSLGAKVLDADKVGHSIYEPNTEGWTRVHSIFGDLVVDHQSGRIDRGKLAALVFDDEQRRIFLNEAIHPLIRIEIERLINKHKTDGVEVLVIEATLFFEAGWQDIADEVWAISAPKQVIIRRLKEQRRLTNTEINKRLAAQRTDIWRKNRSDVFINNNTDLNDLRMKVIQVWEKRILGSVKP